MTEFFSEPVPPLSTAELFQRYQELELRVTQFSAVEQQLVQARDRLDREMAVYTRMQQFNAKAFRDMPAQDFANLVAESIVDIFEVEFGMYGDWDQNSSRLISFGAHGLEWPAPQAEPLLAELVSAVPGGEARLLTAPQLAALRPGLLLREAMVLVVRNERAEPLLVLVGGSTEAGGRFHEPMRAERSKAFAVLAQQVAAHFANRQGRRTIRAEKELLAATLHSIVDGVIVVDQQQKVKLLNPAAEKYTGWKNSEAVGQTLDAVMVLVDARGETLPNPIVVAFRSGTVVGNVHTLNHPLTLNALDGPALTIVACAIPMLDAQDHVTGGLLVLRDITAEFEADRMKEDFVHAVSHELHTPLTSIAGFIATLRREPELAPELRLEFLQIVEGQTGRLRRLVDAILEISRIESGEPYFQVESLDFRDLLRLSLQEVSGSAAAKGIELIAHSPDRPVLFHGDAMRLQSVITNLLTNAIKFTSRPSNIEITLTLVGGEISLAVQDSGLGIPERELPRIFDKFYRPRRLGLQIPGTGLGLAIVKSIVDQYKGRIVVESQINVGTCFRIFLPSAPPRCA